MPAKSTTKPKPAATGATSAAASAPPPYQVLARRYRSRAFDEVVGQESIASTLKGAIAQGRTAHAYLFCGTRGVGKTSMARIFARALNAVDSLTEREAVADSILRGEDLDVIEIDGASNRGVDDARDLIATSGMSPARSPYKIYIIDEVHMLTQPAFNALLKTMEEPPAHVKFILCTTEPFRVPATIQSRCQRFDFKAIPSNAIATHLTDVLRREGISADEAVIAQVSRLASGSMRDALSLLERLAAAAAGGRISAELSREVLGLPDEELLDAIVGAIANGDAAQALRSCGELLDQGMSPDHALDTIAARLRDALLVLLCSEATQLVELPAETKARLAQHARAFDAPSLVHLIALCDASGRNVRSSAVPRAIFDAVVARLALWQHFAKGASLLAQEHAPLKKKLAEPPPVRAPATAPRSTPAPTPAPTTAPATVPTPAPRDAAIPQPPTRTPKIDTPMPTQAFVAESEALKRHPRVRAVAEALEAAVTRATPRAALARHAVPQTTPEEERDASQGS
jgi:DNA polymerase-3 subunit gamma/tau